MTKTIRPLLSLLFLYSTALGIVYPVAVAVFARLAFPAKASGSVVTIGGKRVGSALIGQNFTRPEFFWGRPSATAPNPYNASASAASNFGPLNPELKRMIEARVGALRHADPDNTHPIPIDLATSSASGLDPHISPAAAFYQVSRIARRRGLPEKTVRRLVEEHIEGGSLLIFGEPRVNVLLLNLALRSMEKTDI